MNCRLRYEKTGETRDDLIFTEKKLLYPIQEKDFDIVLHFLRKWWLNHIRIEDVKYASYVKEKLEAI